MEHANSQPAHFDAVIVGARCAGAATAMLLARAGARVLLVDRHAIGMDTLSTHALMRPAVALLDHWGLLERVKVGGAPPVRRTTFHYGAEVLPIDIKPEGGVDALYAPRRTALDRLLAEAATEAGAEIRRGVRMTGLTTGRMSRVTGARFVDADGAAFEVRADLVIGADGRNSSVTRETGAETLVRAEHASATVYGHFGGLRPDGYHWMYQRGSSAGIIPTNDGGTCVFASTPSQAYTRQFGGGARRGFFSILARHDLRLAAELCSDEEPRLFRFPGAPGYIRRSHGRGWALVGDASYFKDPITAHGITDAFRDAELLSRAILSGAPGALARFQEERDELSMPLFAITDAIAAFDWSLDELKEMHVALNRAMKAELAHILPYAAEARIAA